MRERGEEKGWLYCAAACLLYVCTCSHGRQLIDQLA